MSEKSREELKKELRELEKRVEEVKRNLESTNEIFKDKLPDGRVFVVVEENRHNDDALVVRIESDDSWDADENGMADVETLYDDMASVLRLLIERAK